MIVDNYDEKCKYNFCQQQQFGYIPFFKVINCVIVGKINLKM